MSDLENHPSTWESLLDKGHLDQPCFSIDASKVGSSKVVLGGTNAQLLQARGYEDVQARRNDGKWTVAAAQFSINKTNLGRVEHVVIGKLYERRSI